MQSMINEYKYARGLQPLKIAIHGPPYTGKTTLAKKIAEHYQIHYVNADKELKEGIEKLVLNFFILFFFFIYFYFY